MAEYSNLSATINAQIRANGVQAITGPVLNAVLTAMVNVLGDGYRLAGVAHPADNPGSPDNRVAYLAAEDGTYTNFGGLAVSGEVALLLWDSAWTKATLFSIDAAVTPGSDNLITSGAVDSALTTLANNIAAAYMQLVPAATEGNLAEFDNAGQVRDAGLATSDLATKDGHYPDLFAGFAGNLVDTRSAGTRQSFAFRQSGGDGVNYMRKILGKTEVFNQLIDPTTAEASKTENGITFTKNGDGTISVSGTASAQATYLVSQPSLLAGHKYYLAGCPSGGSASTFSLYLSEGATAVDYGGGLVVDATPGGAARIRIVVYSGAVISTPVVFKPQFADLTLEGLGLTTADQFRALHPLGYYNYNAGVLKNNAATGLETTGFNQWDEVWEPGYINVTTGAAVPSTTFRRNKNAIKVLPSTTYYLKGTNFRLCFYDAAGGYISYLLSQTNTLFSTPANAYLMRFYSEDANVEVGAVCINRSDASRNGIYEPYWKRDIVLGLDNLACHDENNNAVVVNGLDGVGTSQDELIVENGWGTKIIKRRGRRAYQAGDESDATLMTDGTNTDYPLPTPLALTLDNPIPALIEVDNLGTEKRLPEDTADNPQGPFECDSNYSVSTANLVRLLNL